MNAIKILSLFLLILFTSCSTVRVYNDFDKGADFTPYKTYAFHKPGIDKVEISDLDKKRILRAIDAQMNLKGFVKSETPDLLITFFTKEKERVDVWNNNMGWGFGWGIGWNPWMWGGQNIATTTTEGTLFIDLIDAKKKELVWQGEGVGNLIRNGDEKDERINEFVSKILAQYPPVLKK